MTQMTSLEGFKTMDSVHIFPLAQLMKILMIFPREQTQTGCQDKLTFGGVISPKSLSSELGHS